MHGSGIALGDVNGDGWVDIYMARIRESNVLYINKGNWAFEDATAYAGVACKNRYSTGSVYADVDGDRDLDLIVTALGGPNSLFINNGSGIFTETILSSQLDSPGSTSSALADVDNDGDLDIAVNNSNDKPALLRNASGSDGAWLGMLLHGNKESMQIN